MTGYILFYFSFGVAFALFIERWVKHPNNRMLMAILSLLTMTAGFAHFMYDERILEEKILRTLDDFIARVVNREREYNLEQIPKVVPGETID